MESRDAATAADDDWSEMEAAEALASLARLPAVRGGESPRRRLVKVSTTVISSPRCSQAEKEAQRLHRVLANRESARLTLRRRQAMRLELIKTEADLVKENANLKKEKDFVVKEYTSLKSRNEFLKLQMVNVKKAEPRETLEKLQQSSQSETAISATNRSPVFLHNQRSLAPFFWPYVPSSNSIQLQYASRSDGMSSPQFLPCSKDISSWHLGPGSPLVVSPVPWLFPFSDHSRIFHSHSHTDQKQSKTCSTRPCSMSSSSDTPFAEDNHDLSPNHVSEKLNNIVSTTESKNLPKKNPENLACDNSQNMFTPSKARRRRMELMRLKNSHYLHARTPSANC